MTELSQTILREYQVRKTKKQKDRFIRLLQAYFPQLQIESTRFPKSRNLIIGNLDTAKVLLSAHYDTCARLPFPNFITPKKPLISILYSLLIVLPAIALIFVFSTILGFFVKDFWVAYIITLLMYGVIIWFMMAGPANKHNANDNTSGVITLLEIYDQLSDEAKEQVAFVFFDNEEKGVMGSGQFRHKHKNRIKDLLLINFDCVSDGDHFLFGVSKKANAKYHVGLARSYSSTDTKHVMLERLNKVYYPSDQAGFPVAVSVAALKYKKFPGYYMDRIHTKKDIVFDESNIAYLTQRTVQFVESL